MYEELRNSIEYLIKSATGFLESIKIIPFFVRRIDWRVTTGQNRISWE